MAKERSTAMNSPGAMASSFTTPLVAKMTGEAGASTTGATG
jgi:hypothetical protein